MTREWLETIRELAHKSTLGELLMIAPPGSAESDNMRRRLDLLADFAQSVVESVDDDELRAAKVSREAHATGSRSEPPIPDRRTGPLDRRSNKWWKSPKLPDTVEYPRRALVSCFGRRSTDKR